MTGIGANQIGDSLRTLLDGTRTGRFFSHCV
jgi:hypothetical protein